MATTNEAKQPKQTKETKMSDIIRNETAHDVHGVPGRLFTLRRPPAAWKAGTFASQKWVSEARKIAGYGGSCILRVEMRFDDTCRNGHNDFAIIGEVVNAGGRFIAGGCLHEDIASVFPELAHLIKWHLSSTDGPMHYVANTCYLAGDRDCSGRAKGEPSQFETIVYFGTSPVSHKIDRKFAAFISSGGPFEVVSIAHKKEPIGYPYRDKWTFKGFANAWHECPFDDEKTANEWCEAVNSGEFKITQIATAFSEGKARELDAARRAAVWPEATDDQLSLPRAELEAALLARLPALLVGFRADIEAAGFMWSCPSEVA